jgi:protease-4
MLLLLVLFCSLALNALYLLRSAGKATAALSANTLPKFHEALVQPAEGGSKSKIVQIPLRGLIASAIPGGLGETMVDDLKMELKQATEDKNVAAIVLAVDSPGGEVTASDVIYEAVAKARDRKPVIVSMGSLAASGGYYVSCGGTWIIAHDTSFTGSIGVIMETLNYHELFGHVGLEMVVVKSGKFKDLLSGARPLTEEERAYVQGMVNESYDKFVGIVARERKIDEKVLRDGIADGRVLSGKVALENKLIDATGTAEDAYDKAMELGHAKGASVVRYEAPFEFGRIFHLLGQAAPAPAGKVEISLTESLKPKLQQGRLYFLPGVFAE